MLVLDSSVTLSWCFDDEATPAVDAVMRRVAAEGAVVPSLWRYEIANGLQMALRRKRIDAGFRDRMLERIDLLHIQLDSDSDGYAWTASVQIASRHDLTVYDAAYLELAQRRRVDLATLDAALIGAAAVGGVRTIP